MKRFLALLAALSLAFQPALAQQTGGGGGSGLPAGGTASNMLIGTPAWTTVFPNGMTGTTQATGDSTLDVATNQFVALALQGVNPASAVNEATAVAVLPNTPAYANGSAGVGATLTSSTNTALVVDGVTVALNDRVLVKDQASALQDGVYTETQVGDGSHTWILTRATDYNTPSNINYTGTIPVISGTVNALTNWLLTSTITTIGTDSITYTQQTSGAGITTGGTIKCKPPLLKNAPVIGAGGSSCVTLASAGANGQVLVSAGANAAPAYGNIAGVPQGRLTLTSGAPVMTADVTAATTIYYDCYAGAAVLYYNGTGDAADNITSCELSSTINSTQEHTSDLFDVLYDHVSGTICIPTNGSGLGWAGDTGGSTTARGTGYSQLHNTRGYWTNVNAITHCYNGSTDEGTIGADKGTYLGTFYTTAAGQTAMQFNPAAAGGGANPFLGLWNAYNRIRQASINIDNTSGWTLTTNSSRTLDNSSSNRVTWVDGLGQSVPNAVFTIDVRQSTSGFNMSFVLLEDATSLGGIAGVCPASTVVCHYLSGAVGAAFILQVPLNANLAPKIGLHFEQVMEGNNGGGNYSMNLASSAPLMLSLDN